MLGSHNSLGRRNGGIRIILSLIRSPYAIGIPTSSKTETLILLLQCLTYETPVTITFQFPNYVVFLEYNEQELGGKGDGEQKRKRDTNRANRSQKLQVQETKRQDKKKDTNRTGARERGEERDRLRLRGI